MSKTNNISQEQLAQLSNHICKNIGLDFPENKYKDLTRGVVDACGEFGFTNANECIEWLIHSDFNKQTWDTLAGHLTIGETYFFRDSSIFKYLKDTVLHDLIYSRWHSEKYLRIWSAACCTGEEPYSMAMLIDQILPNRKGWSISIIGTDINEKFLDKAKKGIYTQWSFRSTPDNIQKKYFSKTDINKFVIAPEIKRMVSFSYLNLAESRYPSFSNNTNELDLICCRNVLMYFSEPIRKKVVTALASCLSQNGWLIVSPGEADYAKKAGLIPIRSSETTLFQKKTVPASHPVQQYQARYEEPQTIQSKKAIPTVKDISLDHKDSSTPKEHVFEKAMAAFKKGEYKDCIQVLSIFVEKDMNNAECSILMARSYANIRQYDNAKSWCEKALTADPLNPGHYYLMATILQEQGNIDRTIKALNQVLYLDPSFIMAYVALAMIRRKQGRQNDFQKCITNAMHYLKNMAPDAPVPFSDDMTAGRLINMLESMPDR